MDLKIISRAEDTPEVRKKIEDFCLPHIIKRLNENYKGNFQYKPTQGKYAKNDGFLYTHNFKVCRAIIENRTRIHPRLEDIERMGGCFLDMHKIEWARMLCREKKVPFLFITFFYYDGLLAYWKVLDKKGEPCFEFKEDNQTATQVSLDRKEDPKLIKKKIVLPKTKMRILLENFYYTE